MTPPPPGPPPPPPVAIPDGEPFDQALAIWRKVHPTAADELRQRIAADGKSLDDLVDTARTRTEVPLREFVRRAAMYVTRRNTLETRLARLEGTQPRGRPSPEAEIHGLVTSIRRWRDGEALRTERQNAIARLNRELEHAEWTVRHLAAGHASNRAFQPGSPEHKAHLVDSADLWLQQCVAALNSRADLMERLQALGDDKAARARAITAVVTSTGDMAVVQSVAGRMIAPDHGVSRIEAAIRDLDSRLSGLDPDCRAFEQLSGDRQRLQSALEDARKARAGSQTDLARGLVQKASEGSLEHCSELQSHVGGLPELSKALATARGADEHLIAVVAELMGDRQP
jgi:hypothetical protein